MNLVIEALERQLRLEEMAITANNIERDSRKFPGYKGPELHPERPEYIADLKKAIGVLKGETKTETCEAVGNMFTGIVDDEEFSKAIDNLKKNFIIINRL